MLAVALLLFPSQATAQDGCRNRAEVLETYKNKFGERVEFRALIITGAVLEVLVSKEKNTWTMITTSPRGCTLVRAFGKYWTTIPLKQGREL